MARVVDVHAVGSSYRHEPEIKEEVFRTGS